MLPYFKFLSQFWQKEKGKIALIFSFVMLSQLFSLAEPFFFTRILDDFLRRVNDTMRFPSESVFFRQISVIVIIWIGVAFAARTFKNLQLYFVETASDRIGINIFEHAFAHVLSLPLSFHVRHKPGEVFRKISKARDDITSLLTIFFDKIFQNSFSVTLVIIYVFYRAWALGLVLVGFVPLFFLVTYFFTKKIKHTQAEINKINEQLYGTSLEAVNNIEVVKAFVAEEHELQNAHHDNVLSHQNLRAKTTATQQLTFWQGTIVNGARVALLWYGSILAFRGVVTFGDVVLFTFYSFFIYQPLYEIGTTYSKYHEGIASMERLQTLLSEPLGDQRSFLPSPLRPRAQGREAGLGRVPDLSATVPLRGTEEEGRGDRSKPPKPTDLFQPKQLHGEIEFRKVSFSYEAGGRKILDNISFQIPAGEKLAIVGLSGGGKSSIVKLLLRYYEPDSGEILVDGRSIEEYDTAALRQRIGLVMQENVLFNTTLLDNIRYGTFNAADREIEQSAQQAYLEELISQLPDRFKTLVGEKGLKLSGGEKQRVAIARAIIKRPDILIFDEATSSLDSHSEEMIKQAIKEVSKGVTTITVAHRFATVVDADEIILLRAGKIIERGTHEGLLSKRGEYAKLYNLQTQRQQAEEKELEEEEKERILV